MNPLRFLFFALMLIVPRHGYGQGLDPLENSIGIVVATHETVHGYFEDEPSKAVTLSRIPFNCNGFLVLKDDRIYFITVKHVLTKYKDSSFVYGGRKFKVTQDDKVSELDILLPRLGERISKIELSEASLFEVPETWYELNNGTADAMAIDLTGHLEGKIQKGLVIPYEALVSAGEKAATNANKAIALVGYPSGNSNQDIRVLKNGWDQRFGEIIPLGSQRLRGFSFGIETNGGDCGSPVVIFSGPEIRVAGLLRTGLTGADNEGFSSIATDSIVLRDAINRKEMS
jgi:hypothetical protein